MYPRLCNYVVQFAILYFIAKATRANLCSKLLNKPTPWAKEMSCCDFHVVKIVDDILVSWHIIIYINIYIFIYNVHVPPKTTRWPSFLPHVTVRFSCAKATYNNLHFFFGGFLLILRVVKKTVSGRIEMCTIPINVSCFLKCRYLRVWNRQSPQFQQGIPIYQPSFSTVTGRERGNKVIASSITCC